MTTQPSPEIERVREQLNNLLLQRNTFTPTDYNDDEVGDPEEEQRKFEQEVADTADLLSGMIHDWREQNKINIYQVVIERDRGERNVLVDFQSETTANMLIDDLVEVREKEALITVEAPSNPSNFVKIWGETITGLALRVLFRYPNYKPEKELKPLDSEAQMLGAVGEAPRNLGTGALSNTLM